MAYDAQECRSSPYRISIPGVQPDFIEQRFLAPIESRAIKVIRDIERTEYLSATTGEMHLLLFFVTLLATRVPLARFMVDELVNVTVREKLSASLATPEQWAKVLEEMKRVDIEISDIEYTEAKELFSGSRFVATQQMQMRMMLEGAEIILPELVKRNWSTVISSSGSLICSDRPVLLTFTEPGPERSDFD